MMDWQRGGWDPTRLRTPPKRRRRWAFRGRRDGEMEVLYLNRDVSSYLTSTGNPIQYVIAPIETEETTARQGAS